MYSECSDCSDRGYPGRNSWSEPGTADSVSFNGYPIGEYLGVCGTSIDHDINYNTPGTGSKAGVFGLEARRTYKAGKFVCDNRETGRVDAAATTRIVRGAAPSGRSHAGDVIDVSWCVSADHGGIPMFRLCDDPAKVEAVTTPGYTPSLRELEDLEECFQEGLLRCDAVDANLPNCELVSACDGNGDWDACKPGKYIHCSEDRGDGSQWDYSCKNTNDVEDTCGDYGYRPEWKIEADCNDATPGWIVE